jgi:hypothetical protein
VRSSPSAQEAEELKENLDGVLVISLPDEVRWSANATRPGRPRRAALPLCVIVADTDALPHAQLDEIFFRRPFPIKVCLGGAARARGMYVGTGPRVTVAHTPRQAARSDALDPYRIAPNETYPSSVFLGVGLLETAT